VEKNQALNEILDMALAYRKSWVLFTAIELGIFDTLFGRTLRIQELARQTHCDAHRLKSLVNLLVYYTFLIKGRDGYSLATEIQPLADPNRKDSIQKRLAHALRTAKSWSFAAESFRKNLPFSKLPCAPERSSSDILAFHASLGINAFSVMERLLPVLNPPENCRVLDIGGGFGDMCRPILYADPSSIATVLETPPTVALAQNQPRNQRLDNQIRFVGCDFIQEELPTGFDMVLLSSILHIYNDETNQALLTKIHKSLRENGHIVIREIFVEDDYSGPEAGLQFGMHMAINTEQGDVYPPSIITNWLVGAGFSSIRRIDELSDVGTVIIAEKAAPQMLDAINTIA
jgi:SAM-dependent methyltransferase